MPEHVNGSEVPEADEDHVLAMFELINGALVVGMMDPDDEGDEALRLINPIKGTLVLDPQGRQGYRWATWLGQEVMLNTLTIVGQLTTPIPRNISNTYTQITTGLTIAQAGDLPRGGKLVS